MEEGTRGNDWTSEPQQILPGGWGKANKGRGQRKGHRQAQIPTLEGRYLSGGSVSVRAYRKPLRGKFLQTNSAAQVRTKKKKKKRRNSRCLKFDS